MTGKIVTFYSFKGGVGRTMALANVAFIAACNGMKVLVMDWDLEAPGLFYYFKGMLEWSEARELKDAPGILDLVWKWKTTVDTNNASEIQSAYASMQHGEMFRQCVRTIVGDQSMVDFEGSIDYISAGNHKSISTPAPTSYEDALSSFSWVDFFGKYVGGALVNELRKWAKENYDLVLVDSRTGLADVAGVCTMQLPDEVILCFILNRQNIDGIANVAAAIRQKRAEKIILRAIPMRTALRESSEESDARARAIAELTRIGEFSMEAVTDDFRFAIRSADNVPYYETVAPILAEGDASLDVLTNHFVRLTSLVTAREMRAPSLDANWVEIVRRRLQPRNATTEYVASLVSAVPTRALEELSRLIESAFETEADGGALDGDYIVALVDAALSTAESPEVDVEGAELVARALELMRRLAHREKDKWDASLTASLERFWQTSIFYLDLEQQLALLEELDERFAHGTSLSQRFKRLEFRRSIARIFVGTKQPDAADESLNDVLQQIQFFSDQAISLSSEQKETLLISQLDYARMRGDLLLQTEQNSEALSAFLSGIQTFTNSGLEPSQFTSRILFTLYLRISKEYLSASDVTESCSYAIRAAETAATSRISLAQYFGQLAEPILRFRDPLVAERFCVAALLTDSSWSINQLSAYSARSAKFSADLALVVSELLKLTSGLHTANAAQLAVVFEETIKQTLIGLAKRRQIGPALRFLQLLAGHVDELKTTLIEAGLRSQDDLLWIEQLDLFRGIQRKIPSHLLRPIEDSSEKE